VCRHSNLSTTLVQYLIYKRWPSTFTTHCIVFHQHPHVYAPNVWNLFVLHQHFHECSHCMHYVSPPFFIAQLFTRIHIFQVFLLQILQIRHLKTSKFQLSLSKHPNMQFMYELMCKPKWPDNRTTTRRMEDW
jgi:hypothetical protein